MQYQIKFYGLNSATYSVLLHINQKLIAAKTPADILQVIVDNAEELTALNYHKGYHCDLKDVSDSETIAELMSDVLTSKGIDHNYRIAEDLDRGHEVLYYVEVDGVAYHYPFVSADN